MATAIRWALIAAVSGAAVAQARVLNVVELDGRNGLLIAGENDGDGVGTSIARIGDINGDGLDDIAIGALGTDYNGSSSGSAFVLYGRRSSSAFPQQVDLGDLDGSSGFRLDGEAAGDWAGRSVSSAGDINGDGFADLIVGASRANANGERSGRSYVVFGRPSSDPFPAVLQLGSLDGSQGFALNGAAEYDQSGRVTAAIGDINGDGVDDLAVGASATDFFGSASGSTYILFGDATPNGFPAVIELAQLNGANGFRIDGTEAFGNSGAAVASAGDFNADGVDDLLIGAINANRSEPNPFGTGSAFVVFGRPAGSTFPPVLILGGSDSSTFLRLDGELDDSFAGFAVDGAADINGDAYDDLIVGAYKMDSTAVSAGSSYVVFGGPDVVPADGRLQLAALDGNNGFRIDGTAEGDESGRSVRFCGDFNGDGLEDLLVSAHRADLAGSGAGSSYVIYGRPASRPFAAQITLGDLTSSEALRVDGREIDYSGLVVSAAGDLNDDGLDDLLLARLASGEGGGVYAIFGDDQLLQDGFEAP